MTAATASAEAATILEGAETFAEEVPEHADRVADAEFEETDIFAEEELDLLEETTFEAVDEELPEIDGEPATEEVLAAGGAAATDELPEAKEPDGSVPSEESADADSFFSSLRATVSDADDLLALPAAEQAGMLAFLHPAELGKVFQATGDPELKRSVIDTLEHIGNTNSLDMIQSCLDDPDPEIQLYALDAADRLLGVDQ